MKVQTNARKKSVATYFQEEAITSSNTHVISSVQSSKELVSSQLKVSDKNMTETPTNCIKDIL